MDIIRIMANQEGIYNNTHRIYIGTSDKKFSIKIG